MGKSPEKTEFQRLLDTAERQCGQKQLAAQAIGITPSRYSKLYGGEDYSLSVENCLRLAKVTRRPPAEVLRAAGKVEIATLLDELYGAPSAATMLPPDVQALASLIERMTEAQRQAIAPAMLAILGEPIEEWPAVAKAARQPSARRRR